MSLSKSVRGCACIPALTIYHTGTRSCLDVVAGVGRSRRDYTWAEVGVGVTRHRSSRRVLVDGDVRYRITCIGSPGGLDRLFVPGVRVSQAMCHKALSWYPP